MHTERHQEKKTAICSIDVGQGNTKYYLGKKDDGTYRCGLFPSIASPAVRQVGSAFAETKNIITVQADGHDFQVGPDVHMNTRFGDARCKGQGFYTSTEYLALVRGAFHYMGHDRIETLVVGLPVSYMAHLAKGLEELLTGQHVISPTKTVTVEKVWIMEQPLGGLIDYGLGGQTRYTDLQQRTNLTLDWGRYTFDWLVSTGIKIHDRRSGSCEDGISAALKEIASAISEKTKKRVSNLSKVDLALRTGQYSGYAIEPFRDAAEQLVTTAVDTMLDAIERLEDIDQAILVGGDPGLMFPILHKKLGDVPLYKAEDSIFSNVRGYQRAGELKQKRDAMKLRAAG